MPPKLLLGASILLALTGCTAESDQQSTMGLSALKKIGDVDPRFQSYNIEMVEVTGGRFWAPYDGPTDEVYRMRPPVDLADKKLRNLARHLSPAYMRVSGTWANSTYLPAANETPTEPPVGYKQLLSHDQWRSVVAFSQAVDAPIVTSFAVSDGTRDADGIWQTGQAQRLVDLTKQAGGELAAAEFYNEPNVSLFGDLPKGYNAESYARDFRIFQQWAKQSQPDMKILGPGSVGEGAIDGTTPIDALSTGMILSADMMQANPNSLDAVSYHFYGAASQRCKSLSETANIDNALTPKWLDKTLADYNYYAGLRDKFEPGKPLWLTETAQAACGGSPWASTFTDSFRYLNQLGLLAQQGVQVVMHNTLSASDYALIDEDSLTPRPNYWAAILWQRTMGTRVLAAPTTPSTDIRLYAHCLANAKGDVGLLAMNIGSDAQALNIGTTAKIWLMTADQLGAKTVKINGQQPSVTDDGDISGLDAITVANGELTLPAYSIAFIAAISEDNAACH